MEPPDKWRFPSGHEFLMSVRSSAKKPNDTELFKEFIPASSIRPLYPSYDKFDMLLKEHSIHVIDSQPSAKDLFDNLDKDEDRCAILNVLETKYARKVAHGNCRLRRSCSQASRPAKSETPLPKSDSLQPTTEPKEVPTTEDKTNRQTKEDRARRTVIIDNIPIEHCGESKVIDAIAKVFKSDITISKLITLPRNGVEVVCSSATEANLLIQDLSQRAYNGIANVHRSANFHRLFPNEPMPVNTLSKSLKVLCWELPTDLSAEHIMEDWKDNVAAVQKVTEPGKRPYFVLHMKSAQLVKQLTTDGLRWKIKMVRGKLARSNKVPRCIKCQGYFHNVHQCTRQLACSFCSGSHLYGNCQYLKEAHRAKCANCKGNHSAAYSKCPAQLAAQTKTKSKLLSKLSRSDLFGNDKESKNIPNSSAVPKETTQWIPAPPPSSDAWPRLPTQNHRPRSDSSSSSKRAAMSSTDDLRIASFSPNDLSTEALTSALIRAFGNQQVIQTIRTICREEIAALVGNDMEIAEEDSENITQLNNESL